MPERTGCASLLTRLRRMIDDPNSSFWPDNADLQEILDKYRQDFYQEPLQSTPRQTAANTVTYTVYRSKFKDLEQFTENDTYAFRLYNSLGVSPATNLYAVDYVTGIITFTSDQQATAYYLDGRSFDLNAAAAHCWKEKAAGKSGLYDFQTDSQSFKRSQWFEHCQAMAEHFEQMARPQMATLYRGDMNV